MSLSSTGYCLSEVDFDNIDKNLGGKLLNLDKDRSLSGWRMVDSGEIKENKEVKKLLSKVRKELKTEKDMEKREELLDLEHRYETERILFPVTSIEIMGDRDYKIDYVFIEDYNYHGPGSVTQLAELRGFLKIVLEKLRVSNKISHIRYIPIQSIKKIIGMSGHCDKSLIQEGLKRFGIDVNEKETDKSDAIAINITGFYTLCHMRNLVQLPILEDKKENKMAKTYLDSLDKIRERI